MANLIPRSASFLHEPVGSVRVKGGLPGRREASESHSNRYKRPRSVLGLMGRVLQAFARQSPTSSLQSRRLQFLLFMASALFLFARYILGYLRFVFNSPRSSADLNGSFLFAQTPFFAGYDFFSLIAFLTFPVLFFLSLVRLGRSSALNTDYRSTSSGIILGLLVGGVAGNVFGSTMEIAVSLFPVDLVSTLGSRLIELGFTIVFAYMVAFGGLALGYLSKASPGTGLG